MEKPILTPITKYEQNRIAAIYYNLSVDDAGNWNDGVDEGKIIHLMFDTDWNLLIPIYSRWSRENASKKLTNDQIKHWAAISTAISENDCNGAFINLIELIKPLVTEPNL